MKSVQDRRVCTRPDFWSPPAIADLDTLLTAPYVELTDRIIPSRVPARRGPGKPPEVTGAELVCLAVAQVLLRFDDERHWLRAAPKRDERLTAAGLVQDRAQMPGPRPQFGGDPGVAR